MILNSILPMLRQQVIKPYYYHASVDNYTFQSMEKMNSNRKHEKITGVFFIAATTAAIIGVKLYDPILQNDIFLSAANNASTQLVLGAFFELVLACSAVGTGIMLYPHLKRHSESWGLGYALFRLLEVVFILIGVISMLSIVKLSQESAISPEHVLPSLQASGNILKKIYSLAFILGPHFMLGINTFIYSTIFFQTKLVPRKISAVGMLGAVLISIAAILELFGLIPQFSAQIIFWALPIAVYEMVLAGWLIVKGFSQEATHNNRLAS